MNSGESCIAGRNTAGHNTTILIGAYPVGPGKWPTNPQQRWTDITALRDALYPTPHPTISGVYSGTGAATWYVRPSDINGLNTASAYLSADYYNDGHPGPTLQQRIADKMTELLDWLLG